MTGYENNDYWWRPLIDEEFFEWHFFQTSHGCKISPWLVRLPVSLLRLTPACVITIVWKIRGWHIDDMVVKRQNFDVRLCQKFIKVFWSCAILYVAKCNLGKVKLQANVVSSSARDLWGDSRGFCFSWLMLHLMLALWADLCRSGLGCSKQG